MTGYLIVATEPECILQMYGDILLPYLFKWYCLFQKEDARLLERKAVVQKLYE